MVIKFKESFDDELDSKVEESYKDIYLVMNKQRFIINFATVAKFTQLMQLDSMKQEDFDLRDLINLKGAINAIKKHLSIEGKISCPECGETKEYMEYNAQMRNHLIKNLQNLATKQKIDFDDYLYQSLDFLENQYEQEISGLKMKYKDDEQALERFEEIYEKEEIDDDEDDLMSLLDQTEQKDRKHSKKSYIYQRINGTMSHFKKSITAIKNKKK